MVKFLWGSIKKQLLTAIVTVVAVKNEFQWATIRL